MLRTLRRPTWARGLAALATILVLVGCSSSGGSAPGASPNPPPSGSSRPATAPATSVTPTPSVPADPVPSPSISDEADQLPAFPPAPDSPGLPTPRSPAEDRAFVTDVFRDAQADWQQVFEKAGIAYQPAKLVLFSAAVPTACGTESSDVGPFYCPADHTVYLDLSFFNDMQRRYGVGGDFAQAYVVAHELGHHIQNITGLSGQVAQLQAHHPTAANALSVSTELQADCYAGVWAHSTYRRGRLQPGDLDEALKAAATVGDDFLQHAATGRVDPETWTHGSSAQRQHWLQLGYDRGKPSACDTFTSS